MLHMCLYGSMSTRINKARQRIMLYVDLSLQLYPMTKVSAAHKASINL